MDYSDCDDPDKLFDEAYKAWEAIPQGTVDSLIDSFIARIKTVPIVEGESLNTHRDIVKQLEADPRADPEIFRLQIQEEAARVQSFLAESKRLFSNNFPAKTVNEQYRESVRIMKILPQKTLDRLGMSDTAQVAH
jgi:hypothetical protein